MATATTEQKILKFAKQQAKSAKDWHDLHNAIFGIGGKVSQHFSTKSERLAFSKTAEYQQIVDLIKEVSDNSKASELAEAVERSSGKLNIRLPQAIHAANALEAEREGVSLNQLIVSKLSVSLQELVAN